MSQYLTNFYCGNKRGKCNYNEPIPYEKLLDRNFDKDLHKLLEDCRGAEFEKGYCCDPNNAEMQKPMDDEYMEMMNRKFESKIFSKDEHGDFHPNQIPLIKPHLNNGELYSVDVCTCGGTPEEYNKCVTENCQGYDNPSRYQYCKLGSNINKINCVVRSSENEESDNKNENKNQDLQKRCQLEPVNPDTQYIYSHQFKINNLFPDCYLNLCSKDPQMQVLDQLISSSTTDENKYHKVVGDSLTSYDLLKNKNELEEEYQVSEDPQSSLLGLFQN